MYKYIISIILGLSACNLTTDNSTITSIDSIYDIKKDSIFKFDTTGKTQNERLNKLVEISSLRHFDESRTKFIESSSTELYQVTPIVKKGSNYSYEVTSSVYNIGIKHNCVPSKGEYEMDVIGTDTIVNMYYKKIKLMTKWDECRKVDGNESCNALKKIEPYPIKTYFKFDYIKVQDGIMHLSYFRKEIAQIN